MLKSVIFDMDGVIIDSEPVYYRLQKEMFTELGFSVTAREDAMFLGWSDENMWEYLKGRYRIERSVAELTAWSRGRFRAYLQDIDAEKKPVPGAVGLIRDLHENGIKKAIASSSAMATIESVCALFGIRSYFDALVCGADVEKGKPAPDIFLRAAELTEANPGECLVIEDSANGLRAAKAAGMTCVGFNGPFAPVPQNLSAANLVVTDLRDLSCTKLRKLFSAAF